MVSRGLLSSLTVIGFMLVACGPRYEDSEVTGGRNQGRGNSRGYPVGEDALPSQINGKTHGRFPVSPISSETPGSLCNRADELRYPEHIKYCERDVESTLKKQIFINYDKKFGFETTQMQRTAFKIDHLIPLCMGGSNQIDNLWPQHISIYEKTDPVEPFLCDLMAGGRLKQAEAVKIIIQIKQSPESASDEMRKLGHRF